MQNVEFVVYTIPSQKNYRSGIDLENVWSKTFLNLFSLFTKVAIRGWERLGEVFYVIILCKNWGDLQNKKSDHNVMLHDSLQSVLKSRNVMYIIISQWRSTFQRFLKTLTFTFIECVERFSQHRYFSLYHFIKHLIIVLSDWSYEQLHIDFVKFLTTILS